ncbi:hypothetical protein DY000_02031721 [Brassica cretica]|uniref:Transposase MuDR plant domain-containing protein n=1 Tax=Brassica cretica TaxID=69181 RepID=A0ABQ7DKR9_BRACR|nr:hypothetical protein DY000_02031721 [Brassica cretica]
MAQEDYNMDMSTESVEITYSLPAEMMLAPDTPPIHVKTVSKFREEDDEADECFEDDDDDLVEDENHDGEEDDGEEDVDISIVAEADEKGEDYSVYGKVEDEDEEDDDIKDALLSELRLTVVRLRFSFRIYKSKKTLLVTTCSVSGCEWKIRASVKHGTNTFWVTKYVEKHTCSVGDRITQRRHCTPKYVGKLFIDRVGIIDGLNPQHITDAMKNMFGMKLDYTTSYRALLCAQTLVETVSEFREEDDEADEADECFEDDDDDLVEDENHDGEEDDGEENDGEEDDGEEDADISIVAEADENGEDYNVYGNVEGEDEEDDDMCFEDFKKIEGGRSNGNNIYVNQSFVSKDALLSELWLTAVRFRFSFRIYSQRKIFL